jgi:ubiquinone/menaquinone biosynthesis C-methylase UbiE
MQSQSNIIHCYDKTAAEYGARYMNELAHKPLDRLLLQSFAAENKNKGTLLDLGCGPGQTTRFLADAGMTEILGTDLSPGMVETAKQLNQSLRFETADMLSLHYPENSFGSALAFYAIVHFTEEQVKTAFAEINRVLKPGGQFLFSFHTGTGTVHLDEFLGETVNIDFRFFETEQILTLLKETGFTVVDCLERRPYPDAEYPSIRAYIRAAKI